MFARGLDETPVSEYGETVPIKSVGNSTTTPRDLENNEDVKLVLYLLSESVAKRLRKNRFEGQVVEVYVRDNGLTCFHQQRKLRAPTCISAEIEAAAVRIFTELYRWEKPIRSIGVRVTDLRPEWAPRQLDLFVDEKKRAKLLRADRMTEVIRGRYGFGAIQRGIMYRDTYLSSLDATADDHMIHPHSYFERGSRTGCEQLAVADKGADARWG
jgi:DNA polymerase-4